MQEKFKKKIVWGRRLATPALEELVKYKMTKPKKIQKIKNEHEQKRNEQAKVIYNFFNLKMNYIY